MHVQRGVVPRQDLEAEFGDGAGHLDPRGSPAGDDERERAVGDAIGVRGSMLELPDQVVPEVGGLLE